MAIISFFFFFVCIFRLYIGLDSKLCNRPLYIATLDAQKVFDVSHPVLMVKLYEQGINSHLWQLIRSMYSGLTARVQWSGEISSFVNISQGVRQGGILSTHFYKTYNNDLLTELECLVFGKVHWTNLCRLSNSG